MPDKTLLEKCESAFKRLKTNAIEAAARLYQVNHSEAWKAIYPSWSDFIETLGISQSASSKMLIAYKHFCIEGNYKHEEVADVDLERLYLASRLMGNEEEQLEKAKLLTRGELKSQLVADKTGHECSHPTIVNICSACHQRV